LFTQNKKRNRTDLPRLEEKLRLRDEFVKKLRASYADCVNRSVARGGTLRVHLKITSRVIPSGIFSRTGEDAYGMT
jgi:hypothetical protein